MEASKKAKELIEKFKPMVNPYIGSGMLSNSHDDSAILWQAKKCAEVAVDEILAAYPTTVETWNNAKGLNVAHIDNRKYWQEVKTEINNL